jgi:hypothetical protein
LAYPNECLDPQEVEDLANKDVDRLVGDIGMFELRSDPYMNLFGGGTVPNVSDAVRNVVPERALPGTSLTHPVFVDSVDACLLPGEVTQVGNTEFISRLQTLRARGPRFCVKQTRTQFPGSYQSLTNSLKESIREVVAADARAILLWSGGVKLTVKSATDFEDIVAGDKNQLGTNFPNYTPDFNLTFGGLQYLGQYMRETLDVEPYEGASDEGALLAIFSQEQLNVFRDELGIRADVQALTTGRYQMGEDTIKGYSFKGPYHAIAFGMDRRPLRADSVVDVVNGATDPNTGVVNTGGTYKTPVLEEPYVAVTTTKGVSARKNPDWVSAQYEIGFLVGQRAFDRKVPDSFKIPGMDFNSPISNQGLKFKLLSDADCYFWEDIGQHRYEIERMYMPQAPHAVAAILYKRNGFQFTAPS